MKRKPRNSDEKIMGRNTAIEYAFIGLFIAAMPLLASWLVVGNGFIDNSVLAWTMVFATLSFIHMYVTLSSRSEMETIFSREFLIGGKFFWGIGISFVMLFIATELSFLQKGLQTTSLTFEQWGLAFVLGSVVLWVIEIVKMFKRRAMKG